VINQPVGKLAQQSLVLALMPLSILVTLERSCTNLLLSDPADALASQTDVDRSI
jgi:hypothetical protein